MTEAQDNHLARILIDIANQLGEKYEKGQAEHGGNLWDRDVSQDIIEEGLDLLTYAFTNQQRIKQAVHILQGIETAMTDSFYKSQIKEAITWLTIRKETNQNEKSTTA